MKNRSILQKVFFGAGGLLVLICVIIDPIRGKAWSFGYIKIFLLAAAALLGLAGIFVKQVSAFLSDFLSPLTDWWRTRRTFGHFLRSLLTKRSVISFAVVLGSFLLITGLNQKFNIQPHY
jgi:uncharacterized membrane protein